MYTDTRLHEQPSEAVEAIESSKISGQSFSILRRVSVPV